MKLSFERVSRPASLAGIVLLCGLTVVGCNKKQETTESTESTEEGDVEVVVADPVVQCDDQVALSQLRQSIKTNLNSQTQNLFKTYADNSAENPSVTRVNNAVGSVLIDIANPAVIQEANAQGMVTCSASLSLTLPNPDVARANRVYNRSEGRDISQILRLEGVVLNNNMLVSNHFNYVVGMQGGQTTARVVGQPKILTAAADIIAKSQFQAVLDNRNSTAGSNATRRDSTIVIQPAEPNQDNETSRNNQSSNNQSHPNASSDAASQNQQNSSSNNASSNSGRSENQNQSGGILDPATSIDELTVPDDESIEMVIIEEEGTY